MIKPFALSYSSGMLLSKTSLLCFSGSDEYGWWFSAEDDTYDPLRPSDISKGYDESIELVRSTFDNQVIMHTCRY